VPRPSNSPPTNAALSKRSKPVELIDPATQKQYVLLEQEQYDRVRSLLDAENPPIDGGVAPGILRSQQAFWRDLPELLNNKRNHGKWVCYHGDERIGIAKKPNDLIRECLKRGLDEYYKGVIVPHDLPPWATEEVDAGMGEYDFYEIESCDQSGSPGGSK